MLCPKCAAENPETAEFCTRCHAVLLRRCPHCWHEQRCGDVCENCGTNIPAYLAMQLERAMKDESRVEMDKVKGWLAADLSLATLPRSALGVLFGFARWLFSRFLSPRL